MIEDVPQAPGEGEDRRVGLAKAGPGLAHLQRKTNGETEARFTVRPAGDLPRDVTESQAPGEARTLDPSTTDVAVLPDDPSVWEARSVADDD